MQSTPLELYQQAIALGHYQADPAQLEAIQQLQLIYDNYIKSQQQSLWAHLRLPHKKKPVTGLYLWGNVGAGKTWLMDLFFNALPTKKKLRLHFHQFMQQVQQNLQARQGHVDPLKNIAKQFALQANIICFDEFYVSDITDAMILGNLFTALFNEGVSLVATSNVHPDNLYYNGLQRSRFLPAIALIKKYTRIFEIKSLSDYRLRKLTQAGVYHYPLNQTTENKLDELFSGLVTGKSYNNQILMINDRPIKTIHSAVGIVWFDFNVICYTPRSQLDYLEIAKQYTHVFISNVPAIAANDVNSASYFIKLVDVFYNQQVKLIISAAVPCTAIYLDGELKFAYQRTASRLIEMQSQEYLERPHLG